MKHLNKENDIVYLFFQIGHSDPLFLYFRLFIKLDSKAMFNINIAGH